MDSITQTYTIPAWKLPSVQERIEKLNKRCRRLSIPEIILTVTGAGVKEFRTCRGERGVQYDEQGNPKPRLVPFNTIEVTGSAPSLAGWQFAATFEHDAETGLTILRRSDAFKGEIPTQYRKASPVCDHCNKARRRNDTYLCYSAETAVFKQIGRNCLRDFLGHRDPHSVASAAEVWFDLTEVFSDKEEDWDGCGGGGSGEVVFDLELFAIRAFAVVRVKGFTGRVKAREYAGLVATADTIINVLLPTRNQRESKAWQALDAETQPTEQDKERALAAIEWARSIDTDTANDYQHNLFVSCSSELLTPRRVGIVASLPAAYLKHLDKAEELRKAKENRKPSNFVGTVGERLKGLQLTLNKVITIPDNGFGESYLHKFEDADGNQFTWFSSSQAWEEGNAYVVTGTVKTHQDHEKYGKSTVLSRCKDTTNEPIKVKTPRKTKKSAGGAPEPIAPPLNSDYVERIDSREFEYSLAPVE